MNTRLLITAALFLTLTACGIDSSTTPAQQPTDQVTEQTAPAESVCKATITEINGNTMLVKPVDGSWELSSADQFSLSASLLDEAVTPTVGMTLEITYDGSILEIYPASFSGVQKVTVVSEPSNITSLPADKGTLMNDLEYEIAKGDSYNSQYKQRGYCIDIVGGKYRYTICSGECHTGGYGIKITDLNVLDCGTVIVTVEETAPAPDETVTEAFTYPNCTIIFSHEPSDGIKIKNTAGVEFESLCSQQKSGIIEDMKKEYQATNYESDLTDKQWEAIKEFFPFGNKSKYHKRSLVEAVLYIVKTGCQWRMLPHDDPPHDTVWSFYRRARENGVWDKMMKHLVEVTRKQAGRNEKPSYALIDSQSVKTTCYGENHGYDRGKKRKEENGTS